MTGQRIPELQITANAVPEAEETVRAIYQGAVDAIVVNGPAGPQIVTLTGADEPYRVLVERMSDGALTVGPDGLVLYANARVAEMSGHGDEELIGRPLAELFTDAPAEVIAVIVHPPESGVRRELKLARGGASMPVSVWAGPVAMGQNPATLITVTDQSVLQRAEAIAAAERFARSILEQATDAILVLDPDGRITHASLVAADLAGREPVGCRFSEAFALETAATNQEIVLERFSADILDTMLATRPFHGLEVRLRGRGRKGSTFLLSAGPLRDDTKQAVGSIVALTDITSRKRAEEQQTVLVAELNHRVKNILAIVQSVAAQTVRKSPSLRAFQETFDGRLRALSVAHDILTKSRWIGVELGQLVREVLGPYGERAHLSGTPVLLEPQSVVPLSMVLHELMTNAAKYGALSGSGHVDLEWTVTGSEGGRALHMTWDERGGPPVVDGAKAGFGTVLIERVTSYDLDGEANVDFRPGGLHCTLQFPIEGDPLPAEAPPASAQALG